MISLERLAGMLDERDQRDIEEGYVWEYQHSTLLHNGFYDDEGEWYSLGRALEERWDSYEGLPETAKQLIASILGLTRDQLQQMAEAWEDE